jgi:hypothetical protein
MTDNTHISSTTTLVSRFFLYLSQQEPYYYHYNDISGIITYTDIHTDNVCYLKVCDNGESCIFTTADIVYVINFPTFLQDTNIPEALSDIYCHYDNFSYVPAIGIPVCWF